MISESPPERKNTPVFVAGDRGGGRPACQGGLLVYFAAWLASELKIEGNLAFYRDGLTQAVDGGLEAVISDRGESRAVQRRMAATLRDI